MDFGAVGLDGFVGSDIAFTSLASDPETKQKWYGSGSLKQERSGATEDDRRSSKLAKTDDFSTSTAMLFQQRNTSTLRSSGSLFSDAQPQQQMLSFASPIPEAQNAALPYSYHTLSAYTRNAGFSSASLNGASMHGGVSGARGPFTPSQWLELEHQALIYKYITANVPVPSNLLIPIRKALDSAGFCSYSGGLLRHNPLGWGSFHLGFSSNTDPEPGRCRRTDGKKWRCSRDAVPDQKYCERHMNRGRHRSRKPVECQSGHAVTGTTTTSKLMPNTSSTVSVMLGGANNSLVYSHQQAKTLQPDASNNGSTRGNVNRMLANDKVNANERKQDAPALSMFPPTMELKSKLNTLMLQEPQFPYEDTPRTQFGLVTSDALVNPSHKSSILMNSNKICSSSRNPSDQHTETPQSLRHFVDDWPKNQSDRRSLSWQDVDRTQLSISIPMGSSDFLPSTSSAANDKVTLSPLRLSRELEPTQKGLGLGGSGSNSINNSTSRQTNWIPISWENSAGGPLGEVLHHSNNNGNDRMKNSSAVLNLVSDGWDSRSPLGSSPTGVLQKTTFRSLSNSSAGSSPRADTKTYDGPSMCNDLLGSSLLNSSSLPAL